MLAELTALPLGPGTVAFYQAAMRALQKGHARFLVGGAYALGPYTGIERHTKDLDLFVSPSEIGRALEVLAAAGYRCELTFPHWLGKAWGDGDFVDLIFSSGSGVAVVDEAWFQHSVPARVFDTDVRLIPVEEMIWSKAFVMERERFDGNDVIHLLRARGPELGWRRLVDRFGEHWRLLLAYLVLFGFVYPGERSRVPEAVMSELLGRLRDEGAQPAALDRVCQGTLLSRAQYLVDIGPWGYRDARLAPDVRMNAEDIEHWTRAIAEDGPR